MATGMVSQSSTQDLNQQSASSSKAITSNEEIWDRVLDEVTSRSHSPVSSAVIILGECGSGKSALVGRLVRNGQKGGSLDFRSVLEHNFVKVNVDSSASYAYQLGSSGANGLLGPSDSATLPIWVLDGRAEVAQLLSFALPPQISHCVLILCASMERPGNVLPELRKWYRIFVEQVSSFYKQYEIEQGKIAQIRFWQEYVEPIESSQMMASSIAFTSGIGIEESVIGSLNGSSLTKGDPSLILPPEQGVLEENCGASVIVVLTKSDRYTDISSDHLDKLQYHVREFCLRHGAALIYTSAKEEKNTQLFGKYIAHRAYSLPFTTPTHIVEKESIFVPAGWDSEQKIALVKETVDGFDVPLLPHTTTDHFPLNLNPGNMENVEVEDEQEFLGRLASITTIVDSQSNGQPAMTSSSASGHQSSSPRGGVGGKPATGGTGTVGTTSHNSGESTALASFFNSLLKKDPGQQ